VPEIVRLPRQPRSLRGRRSNHISDKRGEAFWIRDSWGIPRQNAHEENHERGACYGEIWNDGVLGSAFEVLMTAKFC